MVTSKMGLPQVLVELVESSSMGPGFSLSPLSPGGFEVADKLPTAAAANDTLASDWLNRPDTSAQRSVGF